jgi:lipoprotein NlpD
VKQGDTLYRIALEFGQSYRDIVAWNKLDNANDIKVGQVLRVQPPDSSSGPAGGAQIGSVASGSGVEVRSLGSAPSAAAVASGGNKSGPRGDKRPYSDSALAELQKPDVASSETPKAAATPAVAAPAAAAGSTAATAAPASGDEDKVDWMWPAEGKQVGAFDQGKKGIDIAGKAGQNVVAAAGGKVMYAGSGIRGYGNLVIIKHTSNLLSAYAHNKSILVKEGQTVSKGQKIAEMGNSDSDAVKLHFEIRQQGKPVDPSKFLPSR